MEFTNLIFTIEDGVAIITFNRPKALNAMNSATMNELYEAVSICEKDDAIKAVILAGAGDKAFVAGADISEMANLRPQEGMLFMELGHKTLKTCQNHPSRRSTVLPWAAGWKFPWPAICAFVRRHPGSDSPRS
jgi:enoyl-CoA hydratase